MKPIIMDMKDMSESTEVYESRPNPFVVYVIYLIVLILATALVWMCVSKLEIVVKSNGIFKCDDPIYEVSSSITGQVENCHITDGQYVEEGDVLFTVSVDSLDEMIERCQQELEDVNERIEILQAYEKDLDGDSSSFEALTDNKYYREFADRKTLLSENMSSSEQNTQGQLEQYQKNIDGIQASIGQYEAQLVKLQKTKGCITSRTNSFDGNDSYYNSIVNSYISDYNMVVTQYDNQIHTYQEQLNTYNRNIEEVEKNNESKAIEAALVETETSAEAETSMNTEEGIQEETVSNGQTTEFVVEPTVESVMTTEAVQDDTVLEALVKARDGVAVQISTLQAEKTQALNNLELQQLASIEQQIESVNSTLTSLKSNLATAQIQKDAVEGTDTQSAKNISILTEKGNVAAELLSYNNRKKEYENNLKSYDIQTGNCSILANTSGYVSLEQDLKQGAFVQEGMSIGSIYPEAPKDYYAEIYVENADIAKLEEGQEVKFEIAAYPSEEYGYFTGTIDSIAKDIRVDQASGSAYYLVKVKCDSTTVQNKDGKIGTIMNGMACQAKVIVDEENVLHYLLQKIDLID